MHNNRASSLAALMAISLSLLLFSGCREYLHPASNKDSEELTEIAGMRVSKLQAAADNLKGSGFILRGDTVVLQWGPGDRIQRIAGSTELFGNYMNGPLATSQKAVAQYRTRLIKNPANWHTNRNGYMAAVPPDAMWRWGKNDGFTAMIPSLDIIIAGIGQAQQAESGTQDFKILEHFLTLTAGSVNSGSPYPNSPVIANIKWDDSEQIIRKGAGSDNWPVTWGADDKLYTAFGDGYGFMPQSPVKLSMGLGIISGNPPNFSGSNIDMSSSIQGDQEAGRKVSGILMVNNILFLWVRNANSAGEGSRLAWSTDKGRTLHWSDWTFDRLGYCTFINFGKNNQGARDNYIYSVSHDNPSAYKRADSFVLMRVPADKIRIRSAYEFFTGLDGLKRPIWTPLFDKRGAVFQDRDRCYRSGMSYNKALKRYFWWQAKFREGVDGRFQSKSFAIFDAAEPWGPWSTVYYTENWDVTTGETGCFPTKWMSADGKTMHLVFSGNDAFSVRKARLTLRPSWHHNN